MTSDVRFVSWDWREQVDPLELTAVAAEGYVYFAYVPDTGSDQMFLAAARGPITELDVQTAFNEIKEEQG